MTLALLKKETDDEKIGIDHFGFMPKASAKNLAVASGSSTISAIWRNLAMISSIVGDGAHGLVESGRISAVAVEVGGEVENFATRARCDVVALFDRQRR